MANINVYGEFYNDTPDGFIAPASQIKDVRLGKRQDQINEELMREVSDSNTAYLVCSTPGSTAAKTIDLDNFTLSTNVRLLIKFEHAHTNTQYTPTLNIGGTGIEAIQFEGSVASYMNTWADNEVLDVYYDGTQYVAKRTKYKIGDVGYVECNTAAGTVGKEVNDFITLGGFELGKNVRVLVKMTYTNTASNPTLNINGTGAKSIVYNGEAVSSENVWEDGEVLDVYYNGTSYIARPYLNVDNEPTAGSDNLVKSKGTFNSNKNLVPLIGDIKENLDGFSKITYQSDYPNSYLSNTTGDIIQGFSGFSTSAYIEVNSKLYEYVIKIQQFINNGTLANVVFYDAEYKPLAIFTDSSTKSPFLVNKYQILNLSSYIKYIRVSYENIYPISIYKKPKEYYDINAELEIGYAKTLLNATQLEYSVLENNAIFGETLNGYITSDYIQVSNYHNRIYFAYLGNFASPYIAIKFYDSDKNPISEIPGSWILTDKLLRLRFPKGTKYVRFAKDSTKTAQGIYLEKLESFSDVISGILSNALLNYVTDEEFQELSEEIDGTTSQLEEVETLASKFIYKGDISNGVSAWWVTKYNISGITSKLHIYSDAPENSDVYAYTIQNSSNQKINWATVAVTTQKEFTIDLSQISGAAYLYVTNPRYAEVITDEGIVGDINDLNSKIASANKIFTDTSNILWLGTSIPEGATYPSEASKKCGYNCINNAFGGSQLRWTGIRPSTVNEYSGRCLTATVAELESMFRQDVTGGTITEETLERWKNKSYERSLIPYIDGTNDVQVSMVVIDHGFNDRNNIHSIMQNPSSIDWSSKDRSNFIGAFNYLLSKIQEVNPFIKVVISGYFQNTFVYSSDQSIDYHSSEICEIQELISEHYGISIMKAWEHTQINNSYVSGTDDYIQNFNTEYGTSYIKWNPDGDGNIVSMQLYCPDMVHPHSDLTGNCNKRLNAVYARLLRDLL